MRKKTNLGKFIAGNIVAFAKPKNKNSSFGIINSFKNDPLEQNPALNSQFVHQRATILLGLVSVVFLIFAIRLFLIQIIWQAQYKKMAEDNRTYKEVLYPERGVILDVNGEVLVRNIPGYRLIAKEGLELDEKTLSLLSSDLGITSTEVLEKLEKLKQGHKETLVAENLTKEKAGIIESKYSKFPQIVVMPFPLREVVYPNETAFVVGYIGNVSKEDLIKNPQLGNLEKVGKFALEESYEKYLHGNTGYLLWETDSTAKNRKILTKTDPIVGDSIVLSINKSIQIESYKILNEDKYIGSIIVQNVQDGSLVALVNNPSFNPNQFNFGISETDYLNIINDKSLPLFNRAISGVYPPGSVFKVVVASGALEEGIISKEQFVLVPGQIQIGNFTFKDWKAGGHGLVNISKALAVSSDVFFYALGGGWEPFGIKGLGIEKMVTWAQRFGLGKITGIDISGEKEGFLPSKSWKKNTYNEDWYIGDDFISAIGQGFVQVTPIQIANLTSAIANGGTLYYPMLVKEVKLADGEKIVTQKKVLHKNIVAKSTLETTMLGMKMACSLGGTAYPLFNFKAPLACKTGTSEYGQKDSFGNYKTHAWITVIAPSENPRYAITVFLEGGGEGSKNAGGVAIKVLNKMAEIGLLN